MNWVDRPSEDSCPVCAHDATREHRNYLLDNLAIVLLIIVVATSCLIVGFKVGRVYEYRHPTTTNR